MINVEFSLQEFGFMGTSRVKIIFVSFLFAYFLCFVNVLYCEIQVQQHELLWFSLFNKNVLVSCLLKPIEMLSFTGHINQIHLLHNPRSEAQTEF